MYKDEVYFTYAYSEPSPPNSTPNTSLENKSSGYLGLVYR